MSHSGLHPNFPNFPVSVTTGLGMEHVAAHKLWDINLCFWSFFTQLQIKTLIPGSWVKTFGKLPLWERVCVQSFAIYSFLEALVYKTKAAEKSEAAHLNVSFPKLLDINLVDIHFKFFAKSPPIIDTLLDCLMERCERNAEVQVLRLDEVERLKRRSCYWCYLGRIRTILFGLRWMMVME